MKNSNEQEICLNNHNRENLNTSSQSPSANKNPAVELQMTDEK